jgi:hypothetical protein
VCVWCMCKTACVCMFSFRRFFLQINYDSAVIFFSESSSLASAAPYLLTPESYDDDDGLHLIVCVHGLDGK